MTALIIHFALLSHQTFFYKFFWELLIKERRAWLVFKQTYCVTGLDFAYDSVVISFCVGNRIFPAYVTALLMW